PPALPRGTTAPCPPQPNATRFVCAEPGLRAFPTGLPPATLAVSVEFTALARLAPDALGALPRLRELHLAGNRLRALPEGLLRPVPALRILDLTGNALRDLPPAVFAGARRLRHLVLRGNRLRALRASWFGRLAELRWLDLAENRLAEVPAGAFGALRSLRALDLSRNLLARLPPDLLAGLPALRRLDLEGNRLRALPAALFAPAPALRYLFLQRNELGALPAGLFGPLRHLRVLDLAHNRLRALELPPAPRAGRPALALDISGNPWACECRLLALLRRAAPALAAGARCASPAALRGRPLAALRRRLQLSPALPVATASGYTGEGLAKLEEKLPTLRDPSEKVLAETRRLVASAAAGARRAASGAVGTVRSSVERTRAAVGTVMGTVASSPAGRMVAAALEAALAAAEELLDRYLPGTDEEPGELSRSRGNPKPGNAAWWRFELSPGKRRANIALVPAARPAPAYL
ncbi:leucine-rich alpha-2-glycoprotein, partial [Rhea pennata]|uniref:leucine-rich alpha-2-glycoprotein n=1 Tax=Rhea pennata TaxID=8795 RepID=UPI002E25D030